MSPSAYGVGSVRACLVPSSLALADTDDRPKGGHPNRRRLREARDTVASRRSARRLDINAIDAVQETLDGMVQDLRLAQKMCDQLEEKDLWRDTMVGRIPNEWIRLRDDYRQQVAALAESMVVRGIAEKAVNIQAAQAALMATMYKDALVRAGLDAEQIQRVGIELRQIAQEASTG